MVGEVDRRLSHLRRRHEWAHARGRRSAPSVDSMRSPGTTGRLSADGRDAFARHDEIDPWVGWLCADLSARPPRTRWPAPQPPSVASFISRGRISHHRDRAVVLDLGSTSRTLRTSIISRPPDPCVPSHCQTSISRASSSLRSNNCPLLSRVRRHVEQGRHQHQLEHAVSSTNSARCRAE